MDLYITLLGGDGLASKDANGLSDPYAKVEIRNSSGALLEGMRKETKVVRRTLNPIWNERVLFSNVPLDGSMVLECWDWDRIGGHDFMGTAKVAVRELVSNRDQVWVLTLEARPGQRDEVSGVLRVKVQCVDSTGLSGPSLGLTLRQSFHAVQAPAASGGASARAHTATQDTAFPPLHRAAFLNDIATLQLLLPQAPPLHSFVAPISGWTALHYAAFAGNADSLALLLPRVSGRVSGLLHAAAQGTVASCSACVRLLLERGGATVEVSELCTPLLLSPLHVVCTLYCPERYNAFRALLEAGLDINLCDALGRTPLLRLVEAGAEAPVQFVLGLGQRLDVNAKVEAALKQLALSKPTEASGLSNLLRKNLLKDRKTSAIGK